MPIRLRLLLLAVLCASPAHAAPPADCEWQVAGKLDIAPVWSGHPIGFCLLTHGDTQFAAYYDAGRRMTVASRSLDSDRWDYAVLPSTLGWDSHNYITLTVDDDGFLHLCGNMHCVPLIYFLRWETLPQNRDRPREGELPEPSTLRLYQLHRD